MSFYLDDDHDQPLSAEICLNCSGTSFYNDPISGTLTCSSCYTQSQTATQEELDVGEALTLAARGGKRSYTSGWKIKEKGERGRVGVEARDLAEYDRSGKLPDVESCCSAFQWLLWDASRRVSNLAGIQECNKNGVHSYPDDNSNGHHSRLEKTVKKIWLTYLTHWMEATAVYSAKYPEMRVSFRDYFIENARKRYVNQQLSVTLGKKIEEEILEEMQTEQRTKKCKKEDDGSVNDRTATNRSDKSMCKADGGISSQNFDKIKSNIEGEDLHSFSANHNSGSKLKPTPCKRKKKRRPIPTIAALCNRIFRSKPLLHLNSAYNMKPHEAVLRIQPSLTLLLSILQLALTHLQTGVAPYHLTTWCRNGLLPHALNGYALLPPILREKVFMVKNFFARSFVPPANVVADFTQLLAAAIGWYDSLETPPKDDVVHNNIDGSGILEEDSSVVQQDSQIKSDDLSSISGLKSMPPFLHKRKRGKSQKIDGKLSSKSNQLHHKSLYNVPLLAARMVQDLGLNQQVLNTTMALMGMTNDSFWNKSEDKINNENSKTEATLKRKRNTQISSASSPAEVEMTNVAPPSKCAYHEHLFTPLHIAAVIAVACKLCPGWETWKITNLDTHPCDNNGTTGISKQRHFRPAVFVPWNESQIQLIGNGPSLDNYLNFMENTALHGEPKMSHFFEYLPREESSLTNLKSHTNKSIVAPNVILSGAPNANKHEMLQMQYNKSYSIGRYTTYKYRQHGIRKLLTLEPYHPHYCRLLEYICFVVEEINPSKLHNIVEAIEEELFHLSGNGQSANSKHY